MKPVGNTQEEIKEDKQYERNSRIRIPVISLFFFSPHVLQLSPLLVHSPASSSSPMHLRAASHHPTLSRGEKFNLCIFIVVAS